MLQIEINKMLTFKIKIKIKNNYDAINAFIFIKNIILSSICLFNV